MLEELQWHCVCAASDVVSGTGVAAKVAGQQLAIFNTSEGFFAVGNHDPFSDANVISRGIVGDVKGVLVVASPVYKQHFCLRSGQCVEDAEVSLPVWPVRVEDDQLQIGIDAEGNSKQAGE